MTKAAVSGNRIQYIDGLKGICAVIVVLHHLFLTFRNVSPYVEMLDSIPFAHLFFSGNYAVFIFVLVSAVLIGYRLQNNVSIELCQMMIVKRYFRLMIPITVVLLIMAIMKFLGLFHHMGFAQLTGNLFIGADVMNLVDLPKAILMSPFGRFYGWLNVLWMLNYIFWGTFICIILAIATTNMPRNKQIFFLLAALFVTYIYDTLYASVVLGFILSKSMCNYSLSTWARSILNILGILILCCIELVEIPFNMNFILSAITFFLVFNLLILRKLFSCSFLVLMGKISFEIYLIHLAVIESFTCLFALKTGFSFEMIILNWCLTLIIVFFVAYLLHFYVEPITVKITNKITRWFLM